MSKGGWSKQVLGQAAVEVMRRLVQPLRPAAAVVPCLSIRPCPEVNQMNWRASLFLFFIFIFYSKRMCTCTSLLSIDSKEEHTMHANLQAHGAPT
jgi:hypothetical protein